MILRVFFSIALASAILFGDFVSPALAQLLTSEQQLKIAELNKKILANPIDFDSFSQRAKVYFTAKRYQEAQQDFEKALILDPRWREGHILVGEALAKNGHTDNAIVEFTKAKKISEFSAHEYLLRAMLFGISKQSNKELEDLNAAISLKPDYAEAYKCRAVSVWQSKGVCPQVISDLKKCLSLNADDKQCADLLAKAKTSSATR